MMAINIMSKCYYFYYTVASRVLDRLSITPASLKLHRLLVIYVHISKLSLPQKGYIPPRKNSTGSNEVGEKS